MNVLEFYVSENNRLRYNLYDEITNKKFRFEGKSIRDIVQAFSKEPFFFLKEEGNDLLLKYSGFKVKLVDYQNMVKNEAIFNTMKPMIKKIKKYEEKKNVDQLKKKKVKRINKVVIGKILAGGIAILLLASTSFAIISASEKNNQFDAQISYETTMSSPNISTTISIPIDTTAESIALKNEESKIPHQALESFEEELPILDENKVIETSAHDESQTTETETMQEETTVEPETTIEETIEEIPVTSLAYEDNISSIKAQNVNSKYRVVIEKYSSIYGLDSNLMSALATQERGEHSDSIDTGGAIGLMQIQVSQWNGKPITAYNFQTQSWETVTFYTGDLANLENNVKASCMIFQTCLREMDYNIIMALQCYNMGSPALDVMLNNYCYDTGKTKEDVINNQYDTGWTAYRDIVGYGDVNYIEHVLQYFGESGTISVMNLDGNIESVNINNHQTEKIY